MDGPSAIIIHSNELGWPAIRTALRSLQIRIAGEAETPDEALRLTIARQPDLNVASTRLACESSLPMLTDLRRIHNVSSKIVLFATAELSLFERLEFYQLNLSGFLAWGETTMADTIFCALRLVMSGEAVVGSPSTVRDYVRSKWDLPAQDWEFEPLTERELAVLHLTGKGLTQRQIAGELGLGIRTVQEVCRCQLRAFSFRVLRITCSRDGAEPTMLA